MAGTEASDPVIGRAGSGRVCQYLRIGGGHGSVYSYPNAAHRCYWGGYRLRPALAHQEQFCLTERAGQCPVLTICEPRSSLGEFEPERRSRRERRPLWKRLMHLS
jgi:hypothetical protein